jgi:hypothetical protein
MSLPLPAPRYELTQVLDDGTRHAALVSVFDLPADAQTHRRGFLGAAVSVGTALTAMGCGSAPPSTSGSAKAGRPRQVDPTGVKWDCTNARAHRGAIHALALGADGTRLASIGADRKLKIWRAPEWSLERSVAVRHVSATGPLRFTADGTSLMIEGAGRSLDVYRVEDGLFMRQIASKGATGSKPQALSADASMLASVGAQDVIEVRSLADGGIVAVSPPPLATVHRMALSADAKLLAALIGHNRLALWQLPGMVPTPTPMARSPSLSNAAVVAMLFSPDGSALALAGYDGIIRVWSVDSGALLATLTSPAGSARALAFAPDGNTLASAGADRIVRLWRLGDNKPIQELRGHRDAVLDLAFGADDRLLFSAGGDGAIKRWRLPESDANDCLFDLQDSGERAVGLTYERKTQSGQTITYTLPCGSPIPPGAVCVCNCVPGSLRAAPPPAARPSTGRSSSGACGSPIPPGARCTCNCICTCQAVRTR